MPGAVLFVTHDRAFLQRLATRIVELDRGTLTSWPGDYQTFLRRKDAALADETTAQEKFDKKLAEEEAWLRQGIKARRTRDEGRVRALMAMRAERAGRRAADRAGAPAGVARPSPRGKMVFEAEHVDFAYDGRAGRPRLLVPRDARRSHRTDRPERQRQDDAAAAAAGRAAAGRRAPSASAPTCRSRTSISSASSSIPSARSPTSSARATTSSTVNGATRHVVSATCRISCSPPSARDRRSRRSPAASAIACCSRGCSRGRPTCSSSTSRPTTSTRDARAARGAAGGMGRHAAAGQPRPRLSRQRRHQHVRVRAATDGCEEFVGGYEDWVRQAGAGSGPRRVRVGQVQAGLSGPSGRGSGSRVRQVRGRRFAEAASERDAPVLQRAARVHASCRHGSRRSEAEQATLHARVQAPEFYKEAARRDCGDAGAGDRSWTTSCWRPTRAGMHSTRAIAPGETAEAGFAAPAARYPLTSEPTTVTQPKVPAPPRS